MTLEEELKEYNPKNYFIHDSRFEPLRLTIEYITVGEKVVSKSTQKKNDKIHGYVISNMDDSDMHLFKNLEDLKKYMDKIP